MELNGKAGDIFSAITEISTVDCHEHLVIEAERTKQKIDVITLFSHYCKGDLEAAGLFQGKPQDEIFNSDKPLMPRWRKFKPYFEAIKYGSYAWPVFAYVRDILGFNNITDKNVSEISAKLQNDNKPGIYHKIIRKICNIEKCIMCKDDIESGDQPFFVYLCRSRSDMSYTSSSISRIENETSMSVHSLQDYVKAIQSYVALQKKAGAVGLKIADAYGRTLNFVDVPASEAEKVFVKIRSVNRNKVGAQEGEILENYLVRRQVEACIDVDMPVVIHTGYQAGNRNDIRNARATELWSLLKSYPKARFDLFHGSFPYVSDMTVLGKYFENVSLNMCWMHIMGPEIARRALREWLDAIPVTKIFAFGGDYRIVEKIYGHLQLARMNVAMVLAEKVTSKWLSFKDAVHIATLMFNKNPKKWYKIK